jgi:histidinol dehydrogenase
MVSESSDVLESACSVTTGLADGLGDLAPDGTVNVVRCESRELSLEFLNELAPEHLEIMVEDADAVLSGVRSAGSVFLGPYSAVALGDYVAGPSHVLPTAGTAARLSGLKAADFRRTMNVISYAREGFVADAPQARLLAGLEGLRNHALSLDIRSRGELV